MNDIEQLLRDAAGEILAAEENHATTSGISDDVAAFVTELRDAADKVRKDVLKLHRAVGLLQNSIDNVQINLPEDQPIPDVVPESLLRNVMMNTLRALALLNEVVPPPDENQ